MLNRFNNNFQKKPFHSHGFAHAANSEGIGAASPETFAQRQEIHRNRQMVAGYKESLLANGRHREMGLRADDASTPTSASAQPTEKAVTHLDRRGSLAGIQPRKPLKRSIDGARTTTPAPRAPSFTEPRHRYNPYQ